MEPSVIAKDDRGHPKVLLVATVSSTLWAFYRHLPVFLRDRGIQMDLAAADGPELGWFSSEYDVQCHALPLTRSISPVKDWRAIRLLAEIVRNGQYDIVHGMSPKGGLIAMKAAQAAGVTRRVYSLLGLPAETAKGFLRWLLVQAEQSTISTATTVLAVSDSLRQRICQTGGVDPDRIHVLGDGTSCGIDLDRFSRTNEVIAKGVELRRELDLPGDAFVIGFAGRIVRDKGIDDLVRAFQKVAESCANAYLLLVGDFEPGRGRIESDTQTVIEGHNRIRRVPFTWDLVPYYEAMDLVALPSYREGFPYLLLEAAAMNLPTVASRATGCVDATIDGETGLLVNVGDVDELANALERLIADEPLRQRLGEAGRARVETLFSEQRLLEKHWRLYTTLMENENRAPIGSM